MPSAQSYTWCCTLNNYEGEPAALFESYSTMPDVRGIAGQAEIGETGTHHLQFVVRYSSKKAMRFVKLQFPRAHLEIMRGKLQQAIDYCTKDDTRHSGPWSYGDMVDGRELGSGGEIIMACKMMATSGARATAEAYPVAFVKHHQGLRAYALKHNPPQRRDNISAEYHFGSPGTGKTRQAVDRFPNAYIKIPSTKWWCGYDGQTEVIIDDFEGTIGASQLKTWFDGYPCSVKVKGSQIALAATTFIVTSNFDLDFVVLRLAKGELGSYYNMTWAALRRRIHKYVRYNADSTTTEIPMPVNIDQMIKSGVPAVYPPEFDNPDAPPPLGQQAREDAAAQQPLGDITNTRIASNDLNPFADV